MATPSTATPAEAAENERALWSHVVPFVAWIFLMAMLGDPAGWKYAVRSVVALGLFLWLRPWRWYGRPQLRHLPLALGAGGLVFVAWVGLESAWVGAHLPGLREAYLRWAVVPLGKLPEPLSATPYAPAVCGWPLALARLAGSALVIAPIEEFFWRGFIYRWMQGAAFQRRDLGQFHGPMFAMVAVVFGLEHAQWAAGIVAGLVYGAVVLRTRDLWAGVWAHVLTNFLLGVYVLATGAYGFW